MRRLLFMDVHGTFLGRLWDDGTPKGRSRDVLCPLGELCYITI
jgi:hypothetical protein